MCLSAEVVCGEGVWLTSSIAAMIAAPPRVVSSALVIAGLMGQGGVDTSVPRGMSLVYPPRGSVAGACPYIGNNGGLLIFLWAT